MPYAHRLSAVRICLLIVGVVLLTATAAALTASAHLFRAAASSRSHEVAAAHALKRRARSRKPPSARRRKCVAARRVGKHRKAKKSRKAGRRRKAGRKLCATRKSKRRALKPGGAGSPSGSPPAAATPPIEPAAPEEPAGPFRFFSPTSFWNEPLSANAPLDPSSATVVGAFDKEIKAAEQAKKGQPTVNTTAWSVPIYTVPDTQATVKVAQEIPYGGKLDVALQAAWDAVPLPPEAKPAAGTDRDVVVWQPSTDKLWEFWGLEKTSEGWQAKWGGAIEKVSSDPGVYGPEAWPGAKPNWGTSATSLSVAGGLITLEDLELGQINHALAIAIPNARGGVYASPARRTDGYSTEPTSLPEGAHLRLDPSLDLASLHLPRLTLMMAEAAQRYGIFVRDSAVNVAFVAQDPTPTGTNPYTGAHGWFEGNSPVQLLASFPWSRLELLKMELHSKA